MKHETLAKYFAHLDRLRESGRTNMWGSSAYLERRFNLGPQKATEIVGKWMETFDHERTADERAKEAETRTLT